MKAQLVLYSTVAIPCPEIIEQIPERKPSSPTKIEYDVPKLKSSLTLKPKLKERITKKTKDDSIYDLYSDDEDTDISAKSVRNSESYYGANSKQEFYKMCKSRTCRDPNLADLKDPRYYYIKSCLDKHIIPKVMHILGSSEKGTFDCSHQGIGKSSLDSISDAIKFYDVKIEKVNLGFNNIGPNECNDAY